MYINNCSFYVTDNVEILANAKADVMQRDGSDYAVLSEISVVSFDFSHFKMEFDYQYTPSTIVSLVDRVVASHWKMMKPLMDTTINRFAVGTIEAVFLPVLQAVCLQEIFNMELTNGEQC